MNKVQEFCSSLHVEGEVCACVLGSLELEEVSEIIESDTFSLVSLIEGTISLHANWRVQFMS